MDAHDVERARDQIISVIHGIDAGDLEASQDQWDRLLDITFVLAGIAERNTSEPAGLPIAQDDLHIGATVLMVKWTGKREEDGYPAHVFLEAEVLDVGDGSARVGYVDGSARAGRETYRQETVEFKMLRPMSHIEFRTALTTPNPGSAITDPHESADIRARYWEMTGAPLTIPIGEQERARTSADTHLWTKVQQEKLIGEGLAVACLDRGVASITRSGLLIQAAFRRAWCRGHWMSRFPKVYGSLSTILEHSTSRRGEVLAVWYSGRGKYTPHLSQYWEHPQFISRIETSAGFPYSEWLAFADAFIAELGETNVHRTT